MSEFLLFAGGYEDSPDTALYGWNSFRGSFSSPQEALVGAEKYRQSLKWPNCSFVQIVDLDTKQIVIKNFYPKGEK